MATGRRELTWMACDALAMAGRKPSISSVREWTIAHHGRKQGSDTDTQADINAWYALLLAMKQEKQSVAGLPEEVAALARTMWLKANAAAADGLSEHRAAIDAELASAQARIAAADSATAAALGQASAVGHALDVAREAIRRLEEAVSAQAATLQAGEARHGALLQARDARIAALVHEGGQKDTEHARHVVELEGLRRHALLQIDEARTESRHWKAEYDRLIATHQSVQAAERRTLAQAQEELAGARGRLSAIEESLAAAEQRGAALEAALRQAQATPTRDTGTRAGGIARPGSQPPVKRGMAFRRRKV